MISAWWLLIIIPAAVVAGYFMFAMAFIGKEYERKTDDLLKAEERKRNGIC